MEELQGVPPGSDDPKFQSSQVVYQRVGWSLILLFLIAASFGVFGAGGYSSQTKASGTFLVEYERVARQYTESDLKIRFFERKSEEPLRLSINSAYLSRIRVETIVPAPSKSEITPDGTIWTFDVAPESRTGELYLTIKPDKTGVASLELRLGGESLWLKQFVLP